ncbi:MAG: hypothetical protein ACLRX6_08005 [Limosilactobacillus pontis]|uniref:Uncharacterized protein n=1 Tax=Limosilactobacillus pontis TaxID=35787 RepID=A0A2J6NKP0_9LACO|nr:hypothetical protein [Limosilactobacillus pontis]PMB81905.1 hypothetical protein CK797_08710 [Limosilactobacillus pontis]
MKLNKTFYKNTDLYLGLVMMVTALAEVVMGRDPYNDVILGLFIIVGLVFIGHALLNTDATDWLISGQGSRLSFNRYFYRNGNFYLGWFLILLDLPWGKGPVEWDDIVFLVFGAIVVICSLFCWRN